ncbi:putative amidase [Colletotrichum spinosum]|uniref:Putative amidase n=1 Tax=Colletotrichum spinosum TaxID=1347390 RepID=A0A4V3HQE4_9PEZI|nr:putative amidase [Colletotrichum spinosum]
MTSNTLPVVQLIPDILGTPEFEAGKAAILGEFAAKVPHDLRLPKSLIENPPKDVTAIPRECGLLTREEVEITETYDAVALAEAIAARKFTSVAVATAFSKRAIIAHQLTCCLVEWFMDEAVAQARTLDEHLERTGRPMGPLHGVPISLKELAPIAGHYSSMGFPIVRQRDTEDSQMVAILRAAGAVFHCKTLMPQAVAHLETISPFGRTLNPHNIHLSSGGSTGGGAALVAMRGSLLTVGSDVGGSIRIPASFCGVYGYKATSYLLPMQGFAGEHGYAVEMNVLASTGPLGVSLRDMDLFTSVLVSAKPHLQDPRLVPIPWTGTAGKLPRGPLRVGFLMHDGIVTPQPPVTRALRWARQQLQASPDFVVRDFAPYRVPEAHANVRDIFFADGGRLIKQLFAVTGEPAMKLTEWALGEAAAAGLDVDLAGSLAQRVARDKFRIGLARHWAAQDVDVVVSPAYVGPACEHDTGTFWNYASYWNYADYPGAVIPTPVRAGRKGEEGYAEAEAVPLGEDDERARRVWEEGDFEGAPIGLQILAPKYGDNELFAALKAFQGPLGI